MTKEEQWYSDVDDALMELTGGCTLHDIEGLYSDHRVRAAYLRGDSPADVVADIRAEVAKIFRLRM